MFYKSSYFQYLPKSSATLTAQRGCNSVQQCYKLTANVSMPTRLTVPQWLMGILLKALISPVQSVTWLCQTTTTTVSGGPRLRSVSQHVKTERQSVAGRWAETGNDVTQHCRHIVLIQMLCFSFKCALTELNWSCSVTLQPFCSFKKPFRAEFCRNGTSSSFVVNDFSSRQTSAGFADTEVMWASEDERILQSEMPASPQRGT